MAIESIPNIIILDDVRSEYHLDKCRWLRANEKTRSIPIIAISNFPEITQEKVVEAGANSFLITPIDINEFIDVIETYSLDFNK